MYFAISFNDRETRYDQLRGIAVIYNFEHFVLLFVVSLT